MWYPISPTLIKKEIGIKLDCFHLYCKIAKKIGIDSHDYNTIIGIYLNLFTFFLNDQPVQKSVGGCKIIFVSHLLFSDR